jgi:diguanylate cyclase (GGDEF)-like protein
MKLRTKIPLLLVPLIVLPLFVVGWIAYSELRETSEQAMFREIHAALEPLDAYMDTEVQTAEANIDLFAKNTLVKKYVLTSDDSQRYALMLSPLLRVFQSYQEAFPKYYEIRILLPDGYEDARQTSYDIDNVTDEEHDTLFFQTMAAAGDRTTTIINNQDNDKISLYVGKPLILRDGSVDPIKTPPKLRGYLTLTIDIQILVGHILGDQIGQTGYLLATDANGKVLFHRDSSRVGTSIPSAILETANIGSNDSTPLKTIFWDRSSYIVGARVHPDLLLFSVLPENELLATSRRLGQVVATITLFTIIITMACLFMALEFLVVKPIQQLRSVSKEIGRGHWDVASGVSSQDELGDLAIAVEDMASSLKKSDKQVRYLAYHDSLTGLPNRAMFKEYLDRAIATAKRNHEQLALLFMDIDDFKRINDSLGHHAGDCLLQEIAERLTKVLRKEDCIERSNDKDEPDELLSRLGGDEFVILMPEIADIHSPGKVARRLIDTVSKQITVGKQECYVGASIGITLYPNDGSTSEELTKNADIAMYHAKGQGKNNFHYYTEAMNVATTERIMLENMLRKAIEDKCFFLHYQPQVDTVTGEVVGLEALLRWHDPERGMIGPEVFIPVAEESGLILPIGEWVLLEACRQARAWQKEGHLPIIMSVNISNVQFARQDVAALIRDALRKSRLDAR